jgi:5-(carboxyamino)imidazole ribonucleotide synthase
VLDRLDAEGVSLAPSSATMRIAQNKREQRERFAAAGLPQPRWQVVTGVDEAVFGLPAIVKAAAGGYDGRGVWRCDTAAELRAVLAELHGRGIEPIVDECVPIERELAMLVARLACGDVALYPLVETVQVDGICREIRAQAFDRALERQAREIAQAVAEVTGVVGILAVELFQAGGKLLINEIATRPHNSGHWTIEGSVTSQFEQHLRAVAGLPLGATRLHYPATVTVNVLGPIDGSDPVDHLADALRVDGAHVHLYGKRSRPGRKLGHVTAVGGRADACRAAAWTAVTALTGEEPPEALR